MKKYLPTLLLSLGIFLVIFIPSQYYMNNIWDCGCPYLEPSGHLLNGNAIPGPVVDCWCGDTQSWIKSMFTGAAIILSAVFLISSSLITYYRRKKLLEKDHSK